MSSCPHFTPDVIPSCTAFERLVFRDIHEFLNDGAARHKERQDFPLVTAGCLQRNSESNSIEVVEAKCVGCGFCVTGCPSMSFKIDDSLAPMARCGEGRAVTHQFRQLVTHENISSAVFRKLTGIFAGGQSKNFWSFADFTSSDEVKNLSPWAMRALTYLLGPGSEGALEVNIAIEGKDRSGRLDVCVRTEREVFIFESKKDFKAMMSEGRVFDQFLDYRIEIDRSIVESGIHRPCHLMVLLGGEETDVFPPGHPESSAHDSDALRRFLKWLHSNQAKTVSAQGLLWLLYGKLAGLERDPLELLRKLDRTDEYVAFTSQGFVCADGDDFKLCTFD